MQTALKEGWGSIIDRGRKLTLKREKKSEAAIEKQGAEGGKLKDKMMLPKKGKVTFRNKNAICPAEKLGQGGLSNGDPLSTLPQNENE